MTTQNFHLVLLLETDFSETFNARLLQHIKWHALFRFVFRNDYNPNIGGKIKVLFLWKILSALTIKFVPEFSTRKLEAKQKVWFSHDFRTLKTFHVIYFFKC